MHDPFDVFVRKRLDNTKNAFVNLFIFLPYFFSVKELLRTLFAPWKNVVTKKTKPGFSMEEFGERIANNGVSRFMGFMIRSSIIWAYIVIQIGLVITAPLLFFIVLLTLPIAYSMYVSKPTPDEEKKILYEKFLRRHLSDQTNKESVDRWFERYFAFNQKTAWWDLKRLMSNPPLGRDLTSGFTPNLDKYATELTKQQAHYRHLIGRQQEIEVVQRILSKSGDANVILVGDQGVGRRTIIEALAKIINEGKCSSQLAYKRILEIDLEKILAESTDHIQREKTLGDLFQEAVDAKNIIVLINNFDKYVNHDKDGVDLTSVMEKYARLNTFQLIGITTPYLYQKYIYSNKQISELFEKVDITEITKDQAIEILLDAALEIEKRHDVSISYDALQAAVVETDRYISTSPLPEKAIELLDEASIYAKDHLHSTAVNAHVVNTVLQQKIHIPTELDGNLKQKLLDLEKLLLARVVYQTEALHKLAATLRKSFVMVGSRKKPLASFLFLGPTGVGKTETAKAVTQIFFGNENQLMRFDMSLYQSKQDISKLIGSPETNEPGLLTETIRQQRFGTLLLDELEKADHDLINIFLTVLDEGYFTDGYGNKVDCTNLLVIATSNAGADFIYKKTLENPGNNDAVTSGLVDYLIEQKVYSPEFLNRFDGVVIYKPLSPEAIQTIAQTMLSHIQQDISQKYKVSLTFSPDFLSHLIKNGYDPRFGARNMQRIVRDEVEDKIAQTVLQGSATPGSVINF